MSLHSSELNRLYDRVDNARVISLAQSYPALKECYKTYVAIRKESASDPAASLDLKECIRPYVRFIYDIFSLPVPFSDVFFSYVEDPATISLLNRTKIAYPGYAKILDLFHGQITSLRKSPDNPLMARMRALNVEGSKILFVSRSRFIDRANQIVASELTDTRVIVPGRGVQYPERIGFALGLASDFFDTVSYVPPTDYLIFVNYDWRRNRLAPRPLFVRPTSAGETTTLSTDAAFVLDDTLTDVADDSTIEQARELAVSELDRQRAPSEDGDLGVARFAKFEGGWFSFLDAAPDAKQLVISDLSDGSAQTAQKTLNELNSGDACIFRYGESGDYIAELANEILGATATRRRAMQSEWKSELKRRVRMYATFDAAITDMRIKGLGIASHQNVRNWESSRSIGLGTFGNWQKLCAFLEITAEKTAEHWENIRTLRRAHIRAGNEIREELIKQLKAVGTSELLRTGVQFVNLPDRPTVQVAVLELLALDNKAISVPQNRIDHPFKREN